MDFRRLLNEPVLIAGLVNTGMMLLVTFGIALTDAQQTAIMGFTNAVLIVVTRALVTPNQLAEARVAAGGSPTQPMHETEPKP